MGKGTIGNRTSYKNLRGYYLSRDYDEKVGGKFSFLLEPLIGNDEELFFYIHKTEDGKYEITGEVYIITEKVSLNYHLRNLRKELPGKTIWYYHIDKDGNVIRKEKGYEI